MEIALGIMVLAVFVGTGAFVALVFRRMQSRNKKEHVQ